MARGTRAGDQGGRKRRIRTGVALSATELCAADVRLSSSSTTGWRRPLDPPSDNGGGWPSLATALSDLSRELGISDGTLVISLMHPLTEVRRLELPPLSDEDLERLLSRNAGRYFVNARGAQIVGASRAAKPPRGRLSPVVAAAAPARLVAAIRGAARDAGWRVEELGPSESAWAAASVALWPAFARQSAFVLVSHDDRTDVLQLEDGRLTGVRRFRPGAADASLVADAIRQAGPSRPRVGAFGRVAPRRDLTRALSDYGITVEAPGQNWADAAEFPDLIAAQNVGGESGPRLRSEEARVLERETVRRVTMWIAAAAVALFVIAGALEFWGVRRELRMVQAQRARIRPEIASTLVGRTTIEAAYNHLATLRQAEAAAPRWSHVVALLSEYLPEEAFLLGMRTRGDSLVVDGLAEHAARVFDALERMPGLTNVRSAAAVRRELQEDGSALEHFTIAGRIEPGTASTKRANPAANAVAKKAEGEP